MTVLRAYVQGPLRDTLLVSLGGALVALGYVLGIVASA